LKPENLLLDEKKNIKVVDFGLSNTYKPGDLLNTACGSPCYAAPEMVAGKRYDPYKVDVWSSGIVLFAMICGYLPFEDPNTNKLYKKIIANQY
jgi:5'-AMP-activated protein kinase catalytic alpha subunit